MAKGTLRSCEACGSRITNRNVRACSRPCMNRLPKPQRPDGEGVQCPYCDGWYSHRKRLLRHVGRLHQDELTVECPGCDRRFLDERAKCTHMGHAHPEMVGPRRNNPRKQRDWNLRVKYGITADDYDRMFEEQGGRCAICPATESGDHNKSLHVDHDHETGEVRGLLCAACNHMVGKSGDDPERLRAAAAYLERS